MISNSRPFHKTHSELLRDKKYLLWRFSPSRELDRYWNVLIKQNLELQKEIDIADGYLKKKSFPKRYLKVEKKEKILQEILFSVQQKRKNKEKKRERILKISKLRDSSFNSAINRNVYISNISIWLHRTNINLSK